MGLWVLIVEHSSMKERLKEKKQVLSEVRRTPSGMQDWASGLCIPKKNKRSEKMGQAHTNRILPVEKSASHLLPTRTVFLPSSSLWLPEADYSHEGWNHRVTWALCPYTWHLLLPFSAALMPPVTLYATLWIGGQGFLAFVLFLSISIVTSAI